MGKVSAETHLKNKEICSLMNLNGISVIGGACKISKFKILNVRLQSY